MVTKFEAIGIGGSVLIMALALYLLRLETGPAEVALDASSDQPALVVVSQDGSREDELFRTLASSLDETGAVRSLVVDDLVVGTGEEVSVGDTIVVDYVGTLTNGQEFDNSKERGEPFTFTVGEGQVITGWDQGVVGMRVGGTRILVIPAELAYGNRAVGPIPRNADLVFAVELIEVRE